MTNDTPNQSLTGPGLTGTEPMEPVAVPSLPTNEPFAPLPDDIRPTGARPLLWAEREDGFRNSHFEAMSHVFGDADGTPNQTFRVDPVMRGNEVKWLTSATCEELQTMIATGGEGTYVFADPHQAKAACERVEQVLGGMPIAPMEENPDDSVPSIADESGYAPTRMIKARWSRNHGVLYLSRVWARTDNPAITQDRDLHDEEFEAALPEFMRQKIVSALVARIVDGWTVPVIVQHPALGRMELTAEVHFSQALKLTYETRRDYNERMDTQWQMDEDARDSDARPAYPKPLTIDLPPPSHDLICSIVGQQLAAKKREIDAELGNTTEEELRRKIVRNARELGIPVDLPSVNTQETGHVLPMTLENMQAEGIDLKGDALK